MKTLYVVGGAMGAGKTTTCRLLRDRLDNSVPRGGDRLWDMHPFCVNGVTKKPLTDNIVAVLNNFLSCPALDNVVFCRVLHRKKILDGLLSRPRTMFRTVCRISLICTSEEAAEAILAGGRQ